jgi:hypothetical protein
VGNIVKETFKPKKFDLRVRDILNLTTAGPNHSISSLSAPFDAVGIASNKKLLMAFLEYTNGTGNSH